MTCPRAVAALGDYSRDFNYLSGSLSNCYSAYVVTAIPPKVYARLVFHEN